MKRWMALMVVLLAGCVVLAAPGVKRWSVLLTWDTYDWGTVDVTNRFGFILYEYVGTNHIPVATAPYSSTNLTLNNVTAGVHTYYLTATNYWGESDYSNPASTPKFPGPPIKVTIPQ